MKTRVVFDSAEKDAFRAFFNNIFWLLFTNDIRLFFFSISPIPPAQQRLEIANTLSQRFGVVTQLWSAAPSVPLSWPKTCYLYRRHVLLLRHRHTRLPFPCLFPKSRRELLPHGRAYAGGRAEYVIYRVLQSRHGVARASGYLFQRPHDDAIWQCLGVGVTVERFSLWAEWENKGGRSARSLAFLTTVP